MYGHSATVEIGTVIDTEGLFRKYSNVNSAFNEIEAENYDAGSGVMAADEGGGCLGYIENGDYAAYFGPSEFGLTDLKASMALSIFANP